jgi:hypothetical protein
MYLTNSSKIIEISIKAPRFYTEASISLENVFKKPLYVYKILIIIRKKPPFLWKGVNKKKMSFESL